MSDASLFAGTPPLSTWAKMSVDAMCRTLQQRIASKNPLFTDPLLGGRRYLQAAQDLLVLNREGLRDPELDARAPGQPIGLHVAFDPCGRLVVEWFEAQLGMRGQPMPSASTKRPLWHSSGMRELMEPLEQLRHEVARRETSPDWDYRQTGTTIDTAYLMAALAPKVLREAIDQLNTRYPVVAETARLVLRPGTVNPQLHRLHLAERSTSERGVAGLTGLTEQTLLSVVPRLCWSAPNEDQVLYWCEQVFRAGGNSLMDWDVSSEVLEFFRANDPAEKHRCLLERQQRLTSAASGVEQVLAHTAIEPRSGWQRAVADLAGISAHEVRTYLRNYARNVYDRLYPDESRLVPHPRGLSGGSSVAAA